ncbi:LysR substrate-binding domain-containing protein [Paraburkholderia sp. XV]|uniref:LysR substrate-binding domain-containing protein n=1 Tax=Paraburkholderia sp. XV TaxID=2831520 RepID=UPI001CD2E6E1|nr:LysR substrate-binding domain-containing protein [Paraburkholderia sp. XV]
MRDFPPLRCVHTFEALARLMSYPLVTEELGIGRVAIHNQIQLLERELGVDLFEKSGHRLTPDGVRYFKAVSVAFDAFRDATAEITESRRARRLRIRADVTFSRYWLAPRLPEFHSRNPGVQVVLEASDGPVNLSDGPVDAAIHLAPVSRTDLCCERLFRNLITPVCTPQYLTDHAALARGETAALRGCTLLSTLPRPTDWPDWLHAAGSTDFALISTLTYESSLVALRAATRGHGIAMATVALLAAGLSAGEFVAPYALTLDQGDAAYYLTHSRSKLTMPGFSAFRDWLLSQQRPS